jgi:hypothetical protein
LRFSLANEIDNQTQLPPIVFPTLDIGPFGPINIPSQISLIQTAFIPSQINFFQTDVIPSIIQFNNIPPIPSLISIFAVEKIPEQIVIEPSTLEMLNTQYSVNCTESITLNNTTDSTEKYETLTESDTCDTPGGQNDKYGGPDTNKIQKVQVVVHDFYVKSPTSMHPRYDAIKILIEDPTDANGFTRKCLVMGSGFPQYNENNIPKYDIKDPVTLTFDDKGKRNFYNFNVPLTSATYGTASNGNSLKRNSFRYSWIVFTPTFMIMILLVTPHMMCCIVYYRIYTMLNVPSFILLVVRSAKSVVVRLALFPQPPR